ncbi:MAG: hypothetical protein LBS02_10945 [Hungatella sp.]|nr:hypothetical protein [Hungatella sp.]
MEKYLGNSLWENQWLMNGTGFRVPFMEKYLGRFQKQKLELMNGIEFRSWESI